MHVYCLQGRVRGERWSRHWHDLVPSGTAQEALAEDYASMLSIGMFLDQDEPFDTLMQRCALIEKRANAASATAR